MIYQRENLPLLTDRPPSSIPSWSWRWISIAEFVTRPFRSQHEEWKQLRLKRLIDRVAACEYRPQLEAVLGPPRYGMAGHLYSTFGATDAIEVYQRGNCVIEMGFCEQKHVWTIGYVLPTCYDTVAHVRRMKDELGDDVFSPDEES